MKNSLLPTLHTHLQHDENMGCANTALHVNKEKQRQSFNIRSASIIRNRAGYLLHLVFLHCMCPLILFPQFLVLEMLILLRQNWFPPLDE